MQVAKYFNKHLVFGSLWLFVIHYQQSHADALQLIDSNPQVGTKRMVTATTMNKNAIFRFIGYKKQYRYGKGFSTRLVNLTVIAPTSPVTEPNSVNINKNIMRTLSIANEQMKTTKDGQINKTLDKVNVEKYPEYNVIDVKDVAQDSLGLNPYQIAEQIKKIFDLYPSVMVESKVLGRTASYNDILLYKITNRKSFFARFKTRDNATTTADIPDKKFIFIVHGLSSMGLSKLCSLSDEKYLKRLISMYLAHLDNFDILFMPMANPDGYLQSKLYTYWNKNVSPQGLCTGVALDRNFDVAWNMSNSMNSCSQRYPGPVPFSEAESRAVRDVFNTYSHKLFAYFHVHSGTFDANVFKGDAVLYPNGFKDTHSDDEKYLALKLEIDEAIRSANFKVLSVTVDSLYNWYGKVGGSSVDYAETIYGIPFAMELVMQIYTDPLTLSKFKKREMDKELNFYALNEIWGRVINATFTYLWTKMIAEEEEK